MLQRLMGYSLTFQEAFQRTGRVLNVAVTAADTHEPPRLLNYLTAPHVVVWSAVAASSAFPFLFLPHDLLAKGGVHASSCTMDPCTLLTLPHCRVLSS